MNVKVKQVDSSADMEDLTKLGGSFEQPTDDAGELPEQDDAGAEDDDAELDRLMSAAMNDPSLDGLSPAEIQSKLSARNTANSKAADKQPVESDDLDNLLKDDDADAEPEQDTSSNLPEPKNDKERKAHVEKLRSSYNKLKEENAKLKAEQERIKLESENKAKELSGKLKEYEEKVTRKNPTDHPKFLQYKETIGNMVSEVQSNFPEVTSEHVQTAVQFMRQMAQPGTPEYREQLGKLKAYIASSAPETEGKEELVIAEFKKIVKSYTEADQFVRDYSTKAEQLEREESTKQRNAKRKELIEQFDSFIAAPEAAEHTDPEHPMYVAEKVLSTVPEQNRKQLLAKIRDVTEIMTLPEPVRSFDDYPGLDEAQARAQMKRDSDAWNAKKKNLAKIIAQGLVAANVLRVVAPKLKELDKLKDSDRRGKFKKPANIDREQQSNLPDDDDDEAMPSAADINAEIFGRR